jgi:hypothetical protein
MGWTTGRSGFDPRQGQRTFPLSSVSRPALGPTQPPVQWVPGVLSPGVKARPGRDADHSSPSSAEVVNEKLYLLSPQVPPWRVTGLLYFFFTFCCHQTTSKGTYKREKLMKVTRKKKVKCKKWRQNKSYPLNFNGHYPLLTNNMTRRPHFSYCPCLIRTYKQ